MNSSKMPSTPPWEERPLGAQLPGGTHSISVSLPTWDDVVGYEEKRPETIAHISTGYPRFVYHKLVLQLARQIEPAAPCLPFPSLSVARHCAEYIRNRSHAACEIRQHHKIYAVITEPSGEAAFKEFWQHTGLGISSRQAEAVLCGAPDCHDRSASSALQAQLAAFYDCAADDIFLQPTGMAAQFAALTALTRRRPGKRTVQLGFPYVDTLKLQERLGCGGYLLHNLSAAPADLAALLSREGVAGCFAEIPGNPLLGCVDLGQITPVLRKHHVPLIADDVVATPFNIDLAPHADLIATSLTKFIAGTGDVMGGALICNPRSPLYAELKSIVRSAHEDLLWHDDAAALAQLSRDFPQRMALHNRNGMLIAERLRSHPGVERVWYPKWEFNQAYEAVRKPEGGYGALITFLPKSAGENAPKVYDALRVHKGPSLGTVFTLACPFTLLAHYTELQWAEACGVPSHLIRLSIGLEEPEELWQRIEPALHC